MQVALLQSLGFVASWNASRCRNGFTVSIIRRGTDFSTKMGPNMPSLRYLWEPPADVPVLDHKSAHLACVVVVPLVVKNWRTFSRIELESLPKHVGRAWDGGRNVVIVDQSDVPITFHHRAKYALGDALVAQSHAESDEFIHGFDISIPIGFSPSGSNSAQSLLPLLHKPPNQRRYWLSFRGMMSMERTADGIQRHALLWLQAVNHTARGRVGVSANARC